MGKSASIQEPENESFSALAYVFFFLSFMMIGFKTFYEQAIGHGQI